MSYAEYLTEDRRLAILRFLFDMPGLSLNDSVLTSALEQIGHVISRDTMRIELAWLEEQGVIKTDLVAGRVLVATLTQRGHDCALGRARIPGIKRPSPRA